VEFIDYECPYCRRGAPRVAKSVAGEEVDVVIRHLPLEGIHPWARSAARAAICTERYGVFAEGHAALLGEEGWKGNSDWEAWALALGIEDTVAFRQCLEDDKTTRRIEEDMWLADRLGVTGTPVFVTSSGVFPGDFEAAIASLAEKIISDAPRSAAGLNGTSDRRTVSR
jgi:protein-disulfide isomerase